jgi:hypothetical protein
MSLVEKRMGESYTGGTRHFQRELVVSHLGKDPSLRPLCANSIGALRLGSGRTAKYLIALSCVSVRGELSRTMNGVLTQSGVRDDSLLRCHTITAPSL